MWAQRNESWFCSPPSFCWRKNLIWLQQTAATSYPRRRVVAEPHLLLLPNNRHQDKCPKKWYTPLPRWLTSSVLECTGDYENFLILFSLICQVSTWNKFLQLFLCSAPTPPLCHTFVDCSANKKIMNLLQLEQILANSEKSVDTAVQLPVWQCHPNIFMSLMVNANIPSTNWIITPFNRNGQFALIWLFQFETCNEIFKYYQWQIHLFSL